MRSAHEIVKAHYDAKNRRDLPSMIADVAPDCRWTEMAGFPCAGMALIEDVTPERQAIYKSLEDRLGTADIDHLLDLLEQLIKKLR